MPFIQVFKPCYFFNLQNVRDCGLSFANVLCGLSYANVHVCTGMWGSQRTTSGFVSWECRPPDF